MYWYWVIGCNDVTTAAVQCVYTDSSNIICFNLRVFFSRFVERNNS